MWPVARARRWVEGLEETETMWRVEVAVRWGRACVVRVEGGDLGSRDRGEEVEKRRWQALVGG